MQFSFDSATPLFQQVADQIEEAIFTGDFAEATQVPSTTEISQTFKLNPATVLKGMNELVAQGLLTKHRGVGMFVAAGAREVIMSQRKNDFFEDYVASLVVEAKKLKITEQELIKMITGGYHD